jgi:hypothetical protein
VQMLDSAGWLPVGYKLDCGACALLERAMHPRGYHLGLIS